MGACKVIILDFIWIDSKMIKILTNLDKFDANETIGTNLVQIWQVWAILIDLNQFWGIWSNLDKFDQNSTTLNHFQVWIKFDKIEPILTSLNQIWKDWA